MQIHIDVFHLFILATYLKFNQIFSCLPFQNLFIIEIIADQTGQRTVQDRNIGQGSKENVYAADTFILVILLFVINLFYLSIFNKLN